VKLIAVCQNGKWGYIDCNDRFVIPAVYDTAMEFMGNFAYASHRRQWGVIGRQGPLCSNRRSMTWRLSGEAFAVVRKNGRYGFYRAFSGQELGWFDDVSSFDQGLPT